MGKLYFYDYSAGGESFPGAAYMREANLYFTTYKNNLFYRLNLQSGVIQEWTMPYKTAAHWPYRKLFAYKNKLIFVPMNGGVFLEFDLNTELFLIWEEVLPDEVSYSFRDGVQRDGQLFLLGSSQNVIVTLDMENMQCEGWIWLPKLEQGDFYVNMSYYHETLLVFCKKKKAALQVDLYRKKCKWRILPETIYHGCLDGEEIYYVSVQAKTHEVCSFNLCTETKSVIGEYEETEKEEAQLYRYWNSKKIRDFIFFLPHETSQLLRIDRRLGRIKSIDPFWKDGCCLRMGRYKAVFDVLLWENMIVVIPYDGNKISLLDEKSGEIKKEYSFPLSKERLSQKRIKYIENELARGAVLKEQESLCRLEDFLKGASEQSERKKEETENVGKKIWKTVC